MSTIQSVWMQVVEPQRNAESGKIISPAADTTVFIPGEVVVRAVGPQKTAEFIPYLRVSNPNGGYRKLKIANNPISQYKPKLDLLEGGNKIDNNNDGLGGPGQLVCEIIRDNKPEDPQILTLLLARNDTLISYDHSDFLNYTQQVTEEGSSKFELFCLNDGGDLYTSDERVVSLI